ncbi:hypothetical protein J8L70_14455 [Pseudoalteromonas sp. MMG010]|uniref:hypothetical protein n=1 Tax=Pseudoalteromonas sp. MMG010 TaxID=2822685 RepID=UPI001B3A74A3|nr:hypothetical protein [Pseudoalteromonas sp. MMG010]MBQ4834449.1 hypothetical protein [Pseudoalteromonas sp. MMG010]
MQSVIKASKYFTAFLTVMFFVSGCASTGNSNSRLNSLNTQLNEIVSDNECTASFQCKVLEVGARACGGPSKYIVYSTLKTKQEDAEAIANNISAIEKEQNSSLAECLPVIPVQSLCLAKQCQIIDIQ